LIGVIITTNKGKFLPQRTIIASSVPQGTYEEVIKTVSSSIGRYKEKLGFKLRLEKIPSQGSVQTLQQLEDGDVDLGIVQGNSNIRGASGGVVVALYDEVYLMFTHHPEKNLPGLLDARKTAGIPVTIACLGAGSQTALDVEVIMSFFGASGSHYKIIDSTYPQARDLIIKKEVDLALFVTGIGQPIIRELAAESGVRILPLSDNPSLVKKFRGVQLHELEPGDFGYNNPVEKINTLSTPALLLAGNSVQKSVASRLTTTLIAHKWEVEKRLPFLNIRPAPDEFKSLLHPGTAASFSPPTEGFFKTYSEHIKLFLAVPAAILALYTFVSHMKKKPKPPQFRDDSDGAC
jgi:TRAP-type uncharacterized transport system substrate-binding protein